VNDSAGQRIEDPQEAMASLQGFWETFARESLPVLRRLGIVAPAPAGP
jgi:hypothetical protein